MTQEEKRIMLAKYAFIQTQDQEWALVKPLPDYFNDLNAVHELEKLLTKEQREQYAMLLIHRISGGGLATVDGYTNYDDACDVITASATQRAEAIGLTLNL
jgi:hypothetical protein